MDYSHKIYTAEEITEMADTWANYNGFCGEKCSKCHKTANVFNMGAGWFCECGHYNVQSWSGGRIPYENPDLGTPSNIIVVGHKKSTKIRKLLESR